MSSSSFPIAVPFAIAMNSAFSVTATQVPLFKPLNHRHLVSPLQRRLRSITPVRCSSGAGAGAGDAVIFLHVGGMMCEGCANSVKKILESRPQVSSANVNLASETAIVIPVAEERGELNWQNQLGEALAQHLTTCGFSSTLRDREDSE